MIASLEPVVTKHSISPKINIIETSLQENLLNLKDLKLSIEKLFEEVNKYKSELTLLKERCESQNCEGSEVLKKMVSTKDNIIQQVASALTRLNESKNFTIIDEIFTIIFKESTEQSSSKTPKKENVCKENKTKIKNTPLKRIVKSEKRTQSPIKSSSSPIKEPIHIKKEMSSSLEDVSFKDESVTEIESTPTRRSPIMFPKKLTSRTVTNSPDYGDKKKCPDEWITSESKSVKLTYIFPLGRKGSGRLRQSKLNVVTSSPPPTVIDVASLSQLGTRGERKSEVQMLIKKESSDKEDTIMPSPTSGPNNFLLTSTIKENIKPKRHLSLKNKSENPTASIKQEDKDTTPADIVDMEESINSLNSNKFAKPKSVSPENKLAQNPNVNCSDNDVSMSVLGPVKMEPDSEILNCPPKFTKPRTPSPKQRPPLVASPDATVCDIDESMSLLRPANIPNSEILNCPSPKKRPLCENINANNMPVDMCSQVSVSILGSNVTSLVDTEDKTDDKKFKRKTPEKVEPVYKEPTVRKKAEKKALPAWCCQECEAFFGSLYKNDPDREEKIATTIKNCSKHRGRNNPARPKTPPGFWDPRWSVPQDTEEFNKRNDA